MLDRLKVLIVEDEPLLLMEAEDQVRDLGCRQTFTASDVSSALKLATTAEYDLALLDVNLGDSVIDPVAEAVAKRDRPMIFVTGYADRFVMPKARATMLGKPFTAASLRAAIEEVLDGRPGNQD